MKRADIIRVALDIEFDRDRRESLKQFISSALDEGEYEEGFEIAISKCPLTDEEYRDLYTAFGEAYREHVPDFEKMRAIVAAELPQSVFHDVAWIVSGIGEIYMTDSLRVAKIFDNDLIWVTPRLSWDGLDLHEIKGGRLYGRYFNPFREDEPWRLLVLSVDTGALITGEIVR